MKFHFIANRSALLAAVSLLAAGSLSSCASMVVGAISGGAPPTPKFMRGASVTIQGAGPMEVRAATVDIMTENDFRLASPINDMMVFEKAGTRHDELMYGAYGSRPMRQRVTITLEMGDDPESISLLAEGKVVREYSNMSGEETGYLLAGGRHRYGKYLKLIKKRAERTASEKEVF